MLSAFFEYKHRAHSSFLSVFLSRRGLHEQGRVPKAQASLNKNIAFSAIGVRVMTVYDYLPIYLYSN